MRHHRLYRVLLFAYPKSFRTDYGEPMLQLFGDQLAERGGRIWLTVLPDLVRTAPNQRVEALMKATGLQRIAALIVLLVGGVAAAIGAGGLGVVAIAAMIVLAVLFTQRRFLATLPGDRAPLRHAVVQAWWAPIAAFVGAALVLAAVTNVFEANNTGGRIFGSAILFAFGATMLLGLMRRPFARDAGNAMILVATVPLFPFWWLVIPPIFGIVIWLGVLASGFGDRIDLRGDPSRV